MDTKLLLDDEAINRISLTFLRLEIVIDELLKRFPAPTCKEQELAVENAQIMLNFLKSARVDSGVGFERVGDSGYVLFNNTDNSPRNEEP